MLEVKDEYKSIGEKLIEELAEFEYIRNSDVKIVYLASDEEKKKNRKIILGQCIKVTDNYKWCCPYDFMIVVYEQNCVELDKRQMEILIQHELHHVGIGTDGNEDTFYVVPHDIEEFWDVIDAHGLEWQGRT